MPRRKWERTKDYLERFTLDIMEGFSTNELVKKAQYGYADEEINDDNFPMHILRARDQGIVLVKFRGGMLLHEALEEASKLNFR